MGYRQYFYRVEKDMLNVIKDFSYDEFIKYFKSIPGEVIEEDDEDNVEVIDFRAMLDEIGAVNVYEFGKYYENAEQIINYSVPMFSSQELKDEFEYYNPVVVGREAVACAVEFYRDKVIKYFKRLLKTPEELKQPDEFVPWYDKRPVEEKLRTEIEDKIREWQMRPYSLDGDQMISSWLYEYEVFQLVDIYRNTDWDKYCLIFYGY